MVTVVWTFKLQIIHHTGVICRLKCAMLRYKMHQIGQGSNILVPRENVQNILNIKDFKNWFQIKCNIYELFNPSTVLTFQKKYIETNSNNIEHSILTGLYFIQCTQRVYSFDSITCVFLHLVKSMSDEPLSRHMA